jgi:adenosine tuberculosinyltransferase
MDFDSFCALSCEQVAAHVRSFGNCVCAFPVNGTRRWLWLEKNPRPDEFAAAYLQHATDAHIALYRMLFDHGVDTLLLPILGGELLQRGSEYTAMALEGTRSLATDPRFLNLYDSYNIRVLFYGDYRKQLGGAEYARLISPLEKITQDTAEHGPRRIFYGLFANDATESSAELAVDFFRREGRPPNRSEMVALYYGEYVDPVRFFIGFDKCSAFDMPLLALGMEDLYFTVAPSLYMTARTLRAILYDHLFARRAGEPEYATLPADATDRMRTFFQMNRENVVGTGALVDGFWYPQASVRWPKNFSAMSDDPIVTQ